MGRLAIALLAGLLIPVGGSPVGSVSATERLEDLPRHRPFRCFVPPAGGDTFDVPLETDASTPSTNLVDGDESTNVESWLNFDCYSYLPARSAFRFVRLSWREFAFAPAILSFDCQFYGVGTWNLFSSTERQTWTKIAGESDLFVNGEDLTPVAAEGRYLKLEVRMRQCPPIGAYTFTVLGAPLEPPSPDAFDDSAATNEGVAATADVLANDLHLDEPVVTIERPSEHAEATVGDDNVVTVAPERGFLGGTSIVYRVTNANGTSSTALLAVSVAARDAS